MISLYILHPDIPPDRPKVIVDPAPQYQASQPRKTPTKEKKVLTSSDIAANAIRGKAIFESKERRFADY